MVDRRLHSLEDRGPRDEFESDFWVAFCALIADMANRNFFTEDFADECQDRRPYGMDDSLVGPAAAQYWGRDEEWPAEDPDDTSVALDYVEFFFCHVSEPTESSYHDYCGNDHPTAFDRSSGRNKYTVQVNGLFSRLGYHYRLREGRVTRLTNPVLDSNTLDWDIPTEDTYLADLLTQAIDAFFDRSGDRKLDGLKHLVDAYERVKSALDSDKKKSVAALVDHIAPSEEVREQYDGLLRQLTDIGNSHAIRHHEVGAQVEELPDELVECLFHLYFAVIRYSLECIK